MSVRRGSASARPSSGSVIGRRPSPSTGHGTDYLEVRFEVATEWFDLLSAALQECGCLGLEYRDTTNPRRLQILAYFREPARPGSVLERLLPWLRAYDADPDLRCERLEEQDWNSLWRSTYRPVEIGTGLVVLPSWSRRRFPGRMIVRIKPDFAFGTGSHETTRLCLEALASSPVAGREVADVGTGSGILAIAAARLGARAVYACDPDPAALANARHNLRLNRVSDQIELVESDLLSLPARRFDLIVANLVLEPLRAGAGSLAGACRPGALVIVSGLVLEQERDWLPHAQEHGLELVMRKVQNDWLLLLLRPASGKGVRV